MMLSAPTPEDVVPITVDGVALEAAGSINYL